MKYLITIVFTLLFGNTFSQVPTGVPQVFGAKFYEFKGYVLIDSLVMMPCSDTNMIPNRPAIVFKCSDSSFYFWNRLWWYRFASKRYVDSMVAANSFPPGGSNTQVQYNDGGVFGGDAGLTYDETTNILFSDDYKFNSIANHSSLRRASVLYGGLDGAARTRDSTAEKRGIARFSMDGSGNLTWSMLTDIDHELLGYNAAITNAAPNITVTFPTVADVHSWSITQDEQFARLFGGFGASTGLGTHTIFAYRHNTWGGGFVWNTTTRTFNSDGANVNNNAPTSITYDSLTGIITMTVTTVQNVGSEQDYKKISAVMDSEGLKVSFLRTLSSATTLRFKITDNMGNVVDALTFNGNTGFTFIMPTWHSQVDLTAVGGSAAWLQPFFTSQGNILIMSTMKAQ